MDIWWCCCWRRGRYRANSSSILDFTCKAWFDSRLTGAGGSSIAFFFQCFSPQEDGLFLIPKKIQSLCGFSWLLTSFFISFQKTNGGSKPRPPKSSSKSSSSNPEELEIEIAEVLYGLMTQSQAPSKKELPSNDSTTKFDSNKSSSDTKSRVSSPISNSTAPPQNSSSLSTVGMIDLSVVRVFF